MWLERYWLSASRRWGRFAAWYFRTRYQLLARMVGLRPVGDGRSPRGTLFIEIDGLGYGHLHKAIQGGYMPELRRLLERGEYRVHRWRCGLAADTPPIQSGLMYGTSEGIVAFYWWDRATQRRINGANPYDMRHVQSRLAARAGHPGLLADGSSYSNIMSGGARWSVLTIAGADTHWYRPGQGLLRALAILSLNPGRVLRFAFDAMWEVVQEMEDRAFVTATDRPRVLEGAFPLVRLLLNVLAREIVTAGTRVDMLRGVPVIYSCYIGYDVVGHHSGPLSRNALRVLRGVDAAVGKLLDTRAWTERAYDVVILSDHGMSGCQPVAEVFEQDFVTWVEAWWRQGVQRTPRFAFRRRWRRLGRRAPRVNLGGGWVSRLAGGVARRSSGWLRTWGRIGAWALELGSSGAIKLGERFLEEEQDAHGPRVTVICCGPLAQLWVKDVERRLSLSEVEALCPNFTAALVDHPAVEVVIGREGEQIVVLGRAGKAILRPQPSTTSADGAEPSPDPLVAVEGENPLLVYEEPAVVARQIASYAAMEACGDLICFAAGFKPDTLRQATPGAAGEWHVYSFENQLGTHASAGGDQAYPFIMLPAEIPFDGNAVITASDLHRFLSRLVLHQPLDRPSERPAAEAARMEAATAPTDGAERATSAAGAVGPATIP
ncbi:MAG TPA: alkaline phosphatase family protein [Chloroflexota bacterium]|nr:alkaline phosphatase family protein [Chloroflexota bacterium]